LDLPIGKALVPVEQETLNDSIIINLAGYDVIISKSDSDRVKKKKWNRCGHKNKGPYFSHGYREKGRTKQIILHRFLVDCPEGMYVDHINGNTLDCRRDNLRICTPAENSRNYPKPKTNTSGYKGVHYDKKSSKWRACIGFNNKLIHLGFFTDIEEAHNAYVKASKKYHKEYGRIY
jgi:hypothetical protein